MPAGRCLEKITVENSNGYAFSVIPFGAALTSFRMPDAKGRIENIALGFDTMKNYLNDLHYLGATVGRFANRIANGKFTINGREYTLPKNDVLKTECPVPRDGAFPGRGEPCAFSKPFFKTRETVRKRYHASVFRLILSGIGSNAAVNTTPACPPR